MTGLDILWAALAGPDLGPVWRPLAWLILPPLVAVCAVIVVVDWRRRIIPNVCNLLIATLGLGVASLGGAVPLLAAATQGALVFGLFWVARALYQAIRSVHGLGLGDVKFLGAAGIWVGLSGVAPLVLVACCVALAFVAVQKSGGTVISARHAVPFGPFLVLGFLVTLALG